MTDEALKIGIDAAHMQAVKSLKEGGIPIGASMMIDGAIVSLGHNRRVQMGSNILHAETDCIERAGHAFDFTRATLFSTLSPCLMCTGAVILFRIPHVVILDDENTGDFEPGNARLVEAGVKVDIIPHPEMIEIMRTYITEPDTRAIWMGDVGL